MWTPKEVRKLIAQIGGLLFGIGGVLFMLADIKATGKINISSNLVSGQIESGSAGLLLLFFSFFLILVPALFSGRMELVERNRKVATREKTQQGLTTLQKSIISALVGGTLTVFFFFGSNAQLIRGHTSFVNLLIIAGYCSGVVTGLLLIGCLIEFFEPSEQKTEIKSDVKSGSSENNSKT